MLAVRNPFMNDGGGLNQFCLCWLPLMNSEGSVRRARWTGQQQNVIVREYRVAESVSETADALVSI